MSRVNKQTVNVHTHYIRCEHCSPEWLPPTGERQVILSTQQVSEGVPTLRYWSGGERAGEGGGIIGLSSAGCKEILFIKREVILLSKGCGLDEAWILRHS